MALSVLLVLPVREGDNMKVAADLRILYLGTVLRNQGYDVTLLDCPKEQMTFRGFRAFLQSRHFDAIGFRCYSRLRPDTYPNITWDECYPIVTTRGCPYPCTYCNTPGLSGKKLRHRSVEHVLEEVRMLRREYNMTRFSIVDHEFTLDRKYATKVPLYLRESES